MKGFIELAKRYWLGCCLSIIALILINYIYGTVCASKILIGFPCPACGMTRAAYLLLTGHIKESLRMHPFLILVIIGIFFSAFIWKKVEKYILFIKIYVIMTVVILVIYYIYRIKMYFPNTEPMTYNPDNYLQHFILFIRKCKIF